ncbi:DUF1236 domain-containing protein [Lichenihabitans sp. PAMC28606]|uniref:DUF1236 domain-containing protein n=1 Tax=Lichenihabitans sp. PAMC28606 TaxID=2880932 RepID=UPI001D09F4E7|nr:DUF1236 domain-containing protein [Lichenihabitans sp. PAMC28606]UDL94355.1 DUF1236 domain-containing protein [Lichenihabitans sp. PAMC28606]
MRRLILSTALVAMTVSLPLVAQAQVVQGTVNGAQNGADQGNAAAGPLGGIVGGAIGAGVGAATGAVGTAGNIVGAVLGADDRPRFHDYTARQHRRSYDWRDGDVQIGAILPPRGVVLYPVPGEFRVDHRYRYAVVNDRTVIVDPRSRRIVDIID